MDALETIMTTRAIRRFTDEPVTDDEIRQCLRAAVQAPSGGNLQPWRFIVVRSAAQKQALAEIYLRAWNRYEKAVAQTARPAPLSAAEKEWFARNYRAGRHLAEHLAESQALVGVLAAKVDLTLRDAEGAMDIGTVYASIYPAAQNFMLAARTLGIGTTLTTLLRVYHEEARAVLGFPERFELAALIPMGRPAGRFGVATRKPAEEVTYWERYGAR